MEKYPVNLNIEYTGQSNRLTVFFRLFIAIPVLIILALLVNEIHNDSKINENHRHVYTTGIVFIPTMLMIVIRKKYPKWWYDWNLELTKFSTRVASYVLLLRDDYPSTDKEQGVHLTIPYPDVKKELNRWLPLIKWLLVFPHLILLCFLFAGVFLVTLYAWFFILFSGRYPKIFFNYTVGILRWSIRVSAYALMLTTDKYPPFRLSE